MPVVAWLGRLIRLAQERESVHRIEPVARTFPERPASAVPDRVDDAQRDHVLEAEQLAHDRSTVRPRARPRNVQVIPPGLGGIAARAVGGDPALERIGRPGELAVLRPLLRGRLRPLLGSGLGPARVVAINLEVDRARATRPARYVCCRHVLS